MNVLERLLRGTWTTGQPRDRLSPVPQRILGVLGEWTLYKVTSLRGVGV